MITASAPGRVNLIGEHTDYNGGDVLPIAIERRTTAVVVRSPAGQHSRAVSAAHDDVGVFSVADPVARGRWWDYIAGVSAALTRDGVPIPEFRISVDSDLPAGAGLSSSAALEMATAFALVRLAEYELSSAVLARSGVWAEREFVGVATGIMDQYASALARAGHALHLQCETGAFDFVPFTDAVLIFDTGVRRSLAHSAFNERRDECQRALALLRRADPHLSSLAAADPALVANVALPPPLDRRARHVVSETRRVQRVVQALRRGETMPGDALFASHASLRDDYACSCPELDWFVEYMTTCPGISGARLTGAGWGGCAIAIGTADALGEAARRVAADYDRRFGRTARTWITHASEGARIESAGP